MKKMIAEFRAFAARGNVLDLAIGVILGSAFNSTISSLVEDIIMPLLGIILGRINFVDLSFTVPGFLGSSSIVITYGKFLQSVIYFFVVAFALFLFVKYMNHVQNRFKRNETSEVPSEPVVSKTEELLSEIRDLMKKTSANEK
jgi:large conductance mechanosensitive channel